jgi:hypothetical protein
MGSREKHGWCALDPRQMRGCAGKRRRLSPQQRLDEGYPVGEFMRTGRRKPHILGAAVAGANAEHRAAIREIIE